MRGPGGHVRRPADGLSGLTGARPLRAGYLALVLVHLVAHLLLLLGLAGATLAAGRDRPRAARAIAGVTLLVALPLQLAIAKHPWVLANLTGWTDVVFWSELWVHLAAVITIAGGLAQPRGARRVRTAVLGAVLVTVAVLATPWPGFAPPSLGRPFVDADDVVRQSSPSSCAAAAAATLLRRLRIEPGATESELAARCLTDPRSGTSDLGLYRGLRLSAPGRGVRFAHPGLAGLRARSAPCIAFVGLRDGSTADPRLFALLRDECGWDPGELHAVVLRGIEPGRAGEEAEVALIDDPRHGHERWSMSHFEVLWTGAIVEVR